MLLAAPIAWAQSGGTAAITGRVVDEQNSVMPGVTVVITNTATGATRTTVTNESGIYQMGALPPGNYNLTAELSGFRSARLEGVTLRVDSTTRGDLRLEVGTLAETVTVQAETPLVNTTDGSLGNALSQEQIRQLPVEAQNVVHLLSLQPGTLFIPQTAAQLSSTGTIDSRYGSVSGARADQQNVTLDGIDVNDPQLQSAFTSAVRMTQEALQEFRVSTSNYGAEAGRSSGPQVSLVTRSGTNAFTGSTYWTFRRTATSSNEYFLKLSQLASGQESKAPKLDKDIFGGSFGGPVRRNRMFFFGNVEMLREQSETPVVRAVPSNSFRDGVLMYRCASAAACPGGSVQGLSTSHAVPSGWYGLSPAQIAALDPLGIGPSIAASNYFKGYPSPNSPGLDGQNIMDFRFAAPIENEFYTYIGRLDFKASDSHQFFGRFNLQDDTIAGAPQFPGGDPRSSTVFNNFGFAVGHDAVLSASMINSFRYGLTRIDTGNIGQTKGDYTIFRFIDPFDAAGATFTNTRETPTHNIVNDLTWLRGTHSIKLGTNLRFTRIPSTRDSGSYLSATVNPSWVAGVGRNNMPGSANCTSPACLAVPAVAGAGAAGYADAWLNILGVLSQSTLRANYDREGNLIPIGTPIERRYAADEYEIYLQDSWQVGRTFTVTAGVRYGLYSPPYEVNGLQVAPNVSMGEWFKQRGENAARGIPDNASTPVVQFDLAGPKNNRRGFYDWDKNNIAPRVSFAWTPQAEEGILGAIAGGGRLVVRGGYSKVFDRLGQGLATNFDSGFAFGMSTTISSPFGGPYETNPAVRFTELGRMPPTVPTAPAGGFPQTPPLEAGIITSSVDDTITTPSAHMASFVLSREFGRDYSIEAGYVGRFGRDLLVRRDLAMPMNLVDTASGMDYFTAAQTIIRATQAAGGDFRQVAPMPYWENMFPGAAGAGGRGLTATQEIARRFELDGPDYITSLWLMDQLCVPSCSKFGPYAYFNRQYDSLAALSSIGRSNYHSLQVSLRKRFSQGFQYDVNYTLSQSKDLGSQVERGSAFGNFAAGGYSGFLVNSWDPDSNYGNSDFDVRHQVNLNWIADLPFGQDRRFGSGASNAVNTIIGDWSLAGLMRWTSGFPFNVYNCRSCWATNWNLQGNAMLVDPNRLPATATTRDVVDGRPSPFADPTDALTYFRNALPGEVGIRNVLRGDGYFVIDASLSKGIRLPWANQRLRIRWDVFNVTNTARFNVAGITMFPDRAGFGRYEQTMATCDGQAGRCMQFALRYEF
ncbi:MAG: carboxypeptidase-like regulatory domain-containing protein [Vicinamibacterales bacterium]|nr:carboxypeptidase-like regulatory domain-containing protein [Vicinamibacterales bacterium]